MVQSWSLVPEFGGKVRLAMANDLFPEDEEEGAEPIRVAALLTPEQHADLMLVVDAWNAMHKALGRKGRGWAAMSLAKRMIVAGVEGFLVKYGGKPSRPNQRPMNAEERAEFIRRAVADIKKRK